MLRRFVPEGEPWREPWKRAAFAALFRFEGDLRKPKFPYR